MQQFSTAATVTNSAEVTVQPFIAQIAGAILLGFVILYGVGLSNMEVAHNAAHDARHAFAFPCH